jgi:hypothetical protein
MGSQGKQQPSHFAAIVNVMARLYDSSLISIRISFTAKEEAILWHLSLERSKSFVSRQATSGDLQSLIDLSLRMRSGITVRERFSYMTLYTRCFVGSEAVSWLKDDQHCTEDEAIELGNRLLNVNFIRHIRHDRFLLNSNQYYRFNRRPLREIVEGLRAPIGIIPNLSFRNSLKLPSGDTALDTGNEGEEEETARKPRTTSEPCVEEPTRASDPGHLSEDDLHREILRQKSSLEATERLKGTHNTLINEFNHLKQLHEENGQTIRRLKIITGGVGAIFLLHLLLRELCACSMMIVISFHAASLSLLFLLDFSSLLDSPTDALLPDDDLFEHFPIVPAPSSPQRLAETEEDSSALDREKLFCLPPPSSWPNRPLLIRRSPGMYLNDRSPRSVEELSPEDRRRVYRLTRPIRIHTNDPEVSVIDIETEIFEGKLFTVFAGLKDSPMRLFRWVRVPSNPSITVSRAKKRLFEVIVQGRFKTLTPYAAVYTGQIFSKPFSYLPPSWLTRTVCPLSLCLYPLSLSTS